MARLALHCPSSWKKGPDTDLLREMIPHIVQRVMEMVVKNICAAS
jgi:hypothetical protein